MKKKNRQRHKETNGRDLKTYSGGSAEGRGCRRRMEQELGRRVGDEIGRLVTESQAQVRVDLNTHTCR